MAKRSTAEASGPSTEDRRKWEVEDALHVLRRAGEIVGDKKLMAEVKKLAGERAEEMTAVAHQAAMLAKSGRISPKAMVKMGKR